MAERLQPRASVAEAAPYVAGARAGTGPGSLAQNEIAHPADAAVEAVVAAAASINRYPDPLATGLRERLAALHAVEPDQILVGNGSDEFFFLLAIAFGGPGRVACCADPPYWGHAHPASYLGTDVVRVPLRDFRHDLAAMAQADADMVYVCNPHNPTGTSVDRSAIAAFRKESRAGLVVVDEAYLDFCDDPEVTTAIPLVDRGDVCVLRTFSKFWGLAGLRIGYIVGSRELIGTLRSIRAPFSVNALAQAAASAVLDHPEHVDANREVTQRNRREVARLFRDAGFASVPSQSNFVLVLCPDAEQALVAALSAAGVSVRPGSGLGLPGSVRVTVPDDEGLELLSEALGREFATRGLGVDG
jgi:histidinol-phosphate aminotransferase